TTPDSFSGDGVGDDAASAVAAARAMAAAGADIVDIGGESTRPNSTPVSLDEELRRVIPAVTALARANAARVGIAPRRPEVASAALDAGAVIANEVWGLRGEPEMAAVVADRPSCALIAMHNQRGAEYDNVVAAVCRGLRESLAIAAEAGIAAD